MQHELVRNTVLELAYVGNKGLDLLGRDQPERDRAAEPPRLRADRRRFAAAAQRHRRHRRGNIPLMTRDRDLDLPRPAGPAREPLRHGLAASRSPTRGRSRRPTRARQRRCRAQSGQRVHRQHPARARPVTGGDRPPARLQRQHRLALPTFDDQSGGEEHPGRLGVLEHRPGEHGLSLHDLRRAGPRALRQRQRSPARATRATSGPTASPGEPCQRSGGPRAQWFNPAAWTVNNHAIGTNGNADRHDLRRPGLLPGGRGAQQEHQAGQEGPAAVPGRDVQRLQHDQLPLGRRHVQYTWTPENVMFDTGNAATATRIVSATPAGGFGQLNRSCRSADRAAGSPLRF